jgi:aryl-alcohol dehydrogenase-like predicted oxidoreductase
VTSAIVGARRPTQIEESAPAGDWTLDKELLEDIEALHRAYDRELA